MSLYDHIVELFEIIQTIRKQYPMVVSQLKHLQKRTDAIVSKEITCFKSWLIKNQNIPDRILDHPLYITSKHPIYFEEVTKCTMVDTVEAFWAKLIEINNIAFPDGKPTEEQTQQVATDTALSMLEQNPLFSEIIDDIKSTVADSSESLDLSKIIESKSFGKVVKNLQQGLKSGKYKPSDLTSTVRDIVGVMSSELDSEAKDSVNTAVSIMDSAERGEQVDINKLVDIVTSFTGSEDGVMKAMDIFNE